MVSVNIFGTVVAIVFIAVALFLFLIAFGSTATLDLVLLMLKKTLPTEVLPFPALNSSEKAAFILQIRNWALGLAVVVSFVIPVVWKAIKKHKNLMKDVSTSGLSALNARDVTRLKIWLVRWRRPSAWLSRTDRLLSYWGGRRLYSFDGFQTCWSISLAYPILIVLFLWAWTGDGFVGETRILPQLDHHYARWGHFLVILSSYFLGFVVVFDVMNQLRWTKSILSTYLFTSTEVKGMDDQKLRIYLLCSTGIISFLMAFIFSSSALGILAFSGIFAIVGATAIVFAVSFVVFLAVGSLFGDGPLVFGLVLVGSTGLAVVLEMLYQRWRSGLKEIRGGLPTSGYVLKVFVTALFSYVGIVSFLSLVLLKDSPKRLELLSSTSLAFSVLVFFGCLPLLNALCDWLSVSFTRKLIQVYRRRIPRQSITLQFLFLDLAVAIILTFLVYTAAITVLLFFELTGWGVRAKDVLTSLASNPWGVQSAWLLMLAFTNIIPSAIHVGLLISGAVRTKTEDEWAVLSEFLNKESSFTGYSQAAALSANLLVTRRVQDFVTIGLVCLVACIAFVWSVPTFAKFGLVVLSKLQ
jgi:hypothetical protein